ncbi:MULTISPECIES: hypothetical protein [Methylomonas]|uniref:Circularly permuted ATPgrasp domain-containing protein n=2 Tax=Methylomonas TaxID=416 RepID=A0A140E457_9GAMM|nr:MULTISPECIES: hypothetical protein [Methylomonas]AMK75181.1 hypothetical protein JT25_001555 [Methylomonas denitrificans]OAH99420.1 hypothetical protein A1342_04660 [Methylomonas methanica]TCV85072.1 hypothetical protein EDE11_106183 [Methylomonas methanica]
MHPYPEPEQTPSAEQLNSDCRCASLNRKALRSELNNLDGNDDLYRMIAEERPNLFAESAVFLDRVCLEQQREIIAALERVIALPAYQQQVLKYAPDAARFLAKAHGVFLGYDFHLSADGPKLIEINSNAGGAMINALLIRAQNSCCEIAGNQQPGAAALPRQDSQQAEAVFMDMFYQEWRAERDLAPLRSIAIVDDDPQNQYMWPEFLLFKHLFEQQKIKTVICGPESLSFRDGALWHGDLKIDLVYNRLTDFGLESEKCQKLRQAYLSGAVVLTPHPRNHALYADKRNLVWLGNDDFLQTIGVDNHTRAILREGIAHTVLVDAQNAEWFWAERKQLFFKPAKGYGSKAAYRGDKLTRRVFEDILHHDYVAQTLVKPSERQLDTGELKLDLRHYVYRGQTQLVCARLYQGQTTNFRTPGGGFAQVVVVS